MEIVNIEYGFKENIYNGVINKIVCSYDGNCRIYFYDGTIKVINVGCDSFNSQYGIPVSQDGRKIFVGSWETGLNAYNTRTGELVWKFKSTRVCSIFVYSKYVIIIKYGKAIIKLNIDNGEVIEQLNSGTIESIYDIGSNYIFIDMYRGKYSVLNSDTMQICKKYNTKLINPTCSLSVIIQNVSLNNNQLKVKGFEEIGYSMDAFAKNMNNFERIIDNEFL